MRSLVILSLHIQLGLMEQLLFILPRKAFISSLITRSTAPIKSSSDVNSLANSCCFVHVTLIAITAAITYISLSKQPPEDPPNTPPFLMSVKPTLAYFLYGFLT